MCALSLSLLYMSSLYACAHFICVLSLYVCSHCNDSHFVVYLMGTKFTLSTLQFTVYFTNIFINSMLSVFQSVFQSVFLFRFTLARTNHLLWTDPEVEPEEGPEVEPDGGPDVGKGQKTRRAKDRRAKDLDCEKSLTSG